MEPPNTEHIEKALKHVHRVLDAVLGGFCRTEAIIHAQMAIEELTTHLDACGPQENKDARDSLDTKGT